MLGSFSKDETSRTPLVSFEGDAGTLLIEGESYPEDVGRFYDPLLSALSGYFSHSGVSLSVTISLRYFNSSSARKLMELFDFLEEKAKGGHGIEVIWRCDSEDDITREFAEDISDELASVRFRMDLVSAS